MPKHLSTLGQAALLLSLAAALPLAAPEPARACGGFFCSSTPVDQNAERVLFKVRGDGKTDMIVQITYQGKAEDFAWLLPLAEPPKKEDLGTFPQQALTSLDAQTGVVVQQPCGFGGFAGGLGGIGAPNAAAGGDAAPMVDVYVRAQIGNYEVAVIGSTDASATAQWLRDNNFRISDAMVGFVKLYTQEGMKFLALKLLPDKSVNDITPFKLTLPGETPSIPLRLSAVAAEPEMGIVTWVLGKQRYEPANAEELSIDNKDLRFDSMTYKSNWLPLVARAVDAAQGRGFVVEDGQLVEPLRMLAENSSANTPAQTEARKALLDLFANTTYLTRLYTRLSPEEMTYDPVFRRSNKGDVSRFRTIVTDNDGGLACAYPPPPVDPCDFAACGALGICRSVYSAGADAGAGANTVAACGCADGATARATFVPNAESADFAKTVSCIDKRLSFLNPGDRNAAGAALPDPCVGLNCGGHGKCVAMNMTATCECEHGYVAEGVVDAAGKRSARCLMPATAIPDSFYNRRPMPRDPSLPVGREEPVPMPTGASDPEDPLPEGNMMAMTPSKPDAGSAGPDAGVTAVDAGATAGLDAGLTPPRAKDDDSCSLRPGAERGRPGSPSLLALAGIALTLLRSRRRSRSDA
jgi:hypothetical protein